MKGTVFQPRKLQLNLDNINRLRTANTPTKKKNRGMCWRGTRTHDLLPCLRARQTPKPLGHQPPRIYRSETDVLMDKLGSHREHSKHHKILDTEP